MFFIGIFGINNRSKVKKEVYFKCTGCMKTKGQIIENYNAFEFFFIPIYKFKKKYLLRCQNCESLYWLKDESIHNIFENGKVSYEDIKEVIYQKEVCPRCSKEIKGNYDYCPSCGHKL